MDEKYFEDRLIRLGRTIKFIRKKVKMTQAELAIVAEIDRSYLQRIEKGKNATLSTFMRICLALQISEKDFISLAFEADSKIFIKNADKLLTDGEALTNDEVRAYANKIKSLREESQKKEKNFTKRLLGGGQPWYNKNKFKE